MARRKAPDDRPLTPREVRFVSAYVETGGKGTLSAEMAGYSRKHPKAAGVAAVRLLGRPAVLRAIREETERRLHANVALGGKVLTDLAKNAQSEAVRFQAANRLLDQAGLQIVKLSEVRHVTDNRTDAELRAAMRALLDQVAELGIAAPLAMIDVTPTATPIEATVAADDGDDAAV